MTVTTTETSPPAPVIGTMTAAQLAAARAGTARVLADTRPLRTGRTAGVPRLPAYCGCCGCVTRYCNCSCCCQR